MFKGFGFIIVISFLESCVMFIKHHSGSIYELKSWFSNEKARSLLEVGADCIERSNC